MMYYLRRNLGYKILSLVIAVLLYYVAYAQQNPQTSKDLSLAPEIVNVPPSLAVKTGPKTAILVVSGPGPLVDALRVQAIKATIDATEAHVGVNRLPIRYELPPGVRGRVGITEGPRLAEVALEKKRQVQYGVDVFYEDAPPAGYVYRQPIPSPRQVTVQGLPTEVERVARVVADLDNREGEGEIDRMVDLVAQDASKRRVDTVELVPARVQVKLGLEKQPATKMVLLSADLSGDPAPGYYVAGYRFLPPMLTVIGAQEVLASRSSLSVLVNIDGIAASTTKTVVVVPPPGLALPKRTAGVHIRLDVRPIPKFGTRTGSTPVVKPAEHAPPTESPRAAPASGASTETAPPPSVKPLESAP